MMPDVVVVVVPVVVVSENGFDSLSLQNFSSLCSVQMVGNHALRCFQGHNNHEKCSCILWKRGLLDACLDEGFV